MDFCICDEQLQPSEHRQGVLWLHVQGLREGGGLKKTLRPGGLRTAKLGSLPLRVTSKRGEELFPHNFPKP